MLLSEANEDWGLPINGFDYGGREKITYDGDLPDGFECGVTTLTGTEGNYTWG